MDISKYRRFVVKVWSVDSDNGFARDWIGEYKSVEPRMIGVNRNYFVPNHPLVNSGDAFWANSVTLCLGYYMLGANDIFRPIFSYKRQKMINEFQRNIARVVKKRNEKMAYVAIVKIKKLPLVLIDEIIRLAYAGI
tara:strand:+ start:244 stop:651 length:408 start_codon:yes stop_codon:yes gene_type:complete